MSNNSTQDSDKSQGFVRCNLRILEDAHPDLFLHLNNINKEGRAEEVRYLMRLGLMVRNGQFSGSVANVNPTTKLATVSKESNLIKDEEARLESNEEENNTLSPQKDEVSNVSGMNFGNSLLSI